jgi:capsular polysaccharide biosynthesis protein
MDLGDILRTIARRWYIMVPIVLVTVALTAAAYLEIPMKYQSTSQISLLSPQQPASGQFRGQSNPFLIFDSSLTSTADLLARNLTSDASVKELQSEGVTEQYTAKLADFAQGPFVALTVTGTDKAHVLESTETLTRFAQTRLQQIQEQNGVPANNMIITTVLIPPQPPQPQLKNKLQNVLALFAAGMVSAFMATFVTEGLVRSRSRRAAAAGVVLVDGGPGPAAKDGAEPVAPAADLEKTALIDWPVGADRPLPTVSTLDTAPLERISAKARPWTPEATAELMFSGQTPSAHNGAGMKDEKSSTPSTVYRSSSKSEPGWDGDPRAGD